MLKSDDIDSADVNDTNESIQDDNRVTADEVFKALEVSSSQVICNSVQYVRSLQQSDLGFLLQIALRFVEESGESSAAVLLINWWRDIAAKKRCEKKFN